MQADEAYRDSEAETSFIRLHKYENTTSPKYTICLSIVLYIHGCQHHNMETQLSFSAFLQDYYEEYLRLNPLSATSAGDHRYDDQFPNVISAPYLDASYEFYHLTLAKLEAYDREQLSQHDQMSYDILKWECVIASERSQFPFELTPIDQMWSVNLYIGQLASGASTQAFCTAIDYDNWLKRLDDYLEWCQTAIENMKRGIEKGVVLPAALITKVIPQFQRLAVGKVQEHLFYQPVLTLPEMITGTDRDRIKAEYEEMIALKIMPMYQRMATFFAEEYLPAGRTSSGVGHYAFGNALYSHMIKLYTTTEMKADQIHELGLQEVARLRSEMEKVKEKVEFSGDLNSFFDHVRNKKELMPFTDPQQVIENFNTIHQRMLPQLDQLFDLKPQTPFEVRQTEAFRAASASAEYNPGSVDGSRPGIFYVPIPNVLKYNTYGDENLFLHEAIPGHHYQISLQQEDQDLPAFRKTLWYSAYGEGWALYCESLGEELGLYADPYQYFGMLGNEMHRAIRLVVDTGIHAKGWSRERAIQYSMENEAESEATITSEIERYMAMPGQALSYKIGQMKIQELRRTAEGAFGPMFDIRQFHNIVLETGCVPLHILEDRINNWLNKALDFGKL